MAEDPRYIPKCTLYGGCVRCVMRADRRHNHANRARETRKAAEMLAFAAPENYANRTHETSRHNR